MRRGTLERVPRTPQNFSRLFYCFPETALAVTGGEIRRGLLKESPEPPRTFLDFLLFPGNGTCVRFRAFHLAPGERTISNAAVACDG